VASNHEATLTVKAQVADAQRKMHDLERTVERLAKQLDAKTKALEKSSKATDTVGGSVFSVISKFDGFAGSVMRAVGTLDQWTQRGAKFGAVARNFSGDLNALRSSTGNLISDFDLMRMQNSAMSLGVVKTSQDFANLAGAAQKLGLAVGQTSEEAVQSLIEGLGRGSTEMLDNIGIVLKAEQAQKIYAGQLGKTVSQLTDAEKAEAFRVVALEKIRAKALQVQDAEVDFSSSVQASKVAMQNATDWSTQLDKALLGVAKGYNETYGILGRGTLVGEIGAMTNNAERQRDAFHQMTRDFPRLNTELMNHRNAALEAAAAYGELGQSIKTAFSAGLKSMDVDGSPVGLLAGMAFSQAGKLGYGFDPKKGEKKKRGGGRGGDRMVAGENVNEVSAYIDIGNERDRMDLVDAEERVEAARQALALAEAQEKSIERQWQLQQQLFEAEYERIQQQLGGASTTEEAIALQEERDQLVFDQQVKRAEYQIDLAAKRAKAEEEAARRIAEAHKRTAKAIDDASMLSGGAIQGAADIASTAAEQHGQSAEAAEKKRRAWGAAILAVDAIFYGAKAAAAFASLNPIEGAGFLSAAIISGTKAAQLGASVSGVGGGGRGGGGAGMADRGPIQRERGANAPSSKVPGTAGSPTSLPGGAKGTSGTVVYVNTQVLGAIDEQAAVKIQRGIEDAARSGRIRMGRPS
jgi:hypothetical protein